LRQPPRCNLRKTEKRLSHLARFGEAQLGILLLDHVEVDVVRRQIDRIIGAIERDVGAVAFGELAQFAGIAMIQRAVEQL
jgi:hypothetical protein